MRGLETLVLVSLAVGGVIRVISLAVPAPQPAVVEPTADQACCQYQTALAPNSFWSVPFTPQFHPTEHNPQYSSLEFGRDAAEDGEPDVEPAAPSPTASRQDPPWSFAWAFLVDPLGIDSQASDVSQDASTAIGSGWLGGGNSAMGSEGRIAGLPNSTILAAPPLDLPAPEDFAQSPSIASPSPSLPPPDGVSTPPDPPVGPGPPGPGDSSSVAEPASIGLLAMALAGLAAARRPRSPQRNPCRG